MHHTIFTHLLIHTTVSEYIVYKWKLLSTQIVDFIFFNSHMLTPWRCYCAWLIVFHNQVTVVFYIICYNIVKMVWSSHSQMPKINTCSNSDWSKSIRNSPSILRYFSKNQIIVTNNQQYVNQSPTMKSSSLKVVGKEFKTYFTNCTKKHFIRANSYRESSNRTNLPFHDGWSDSIWEETKFDIKSQCTQSDGDLVQHQSLQQSPSKIKQGFVSISWSDTNLYIEKKDIFLWL